jgi:hypothetical protein
LDGRNIRVSPENRGMEILSAGLARDRSACE